MPQPEPEKPKGLSALAVPNAQDVENARVRQEVAEKFAMEYAEVLAWATSIFGPCWIPSHRHYLVEKDEEERARRDCDKPKAAATVYTVRHQADESKKRHFILLEAGKPVEVASMEAAFGPMLTEPHPSKGFMSKGVFHKYHRYSLCWAGYILYTPNTAEELAGMRERREERKAEREAEKFRKDYPLLAWAEEEKDREAQG